jgi:hypothetical protein
MVDEHANGRKTVWIALAHRPNERPWIVTVAANRDRLYEEVRRFQEKYSMKEEPLPAPGDEDGPHSLVGPYGHLWLDCAEHVVAE